MRYVTRCSRQRFMFCVFGIPAKSDRPNSLPDKSDGGPADVGRFGRETPVSVRSAAVSPTPPAKPDSSRRRCARRRHKAAPITPPQWFAGSAPDPRSRCRARRWPPHCPVPANQIPGRVQDRAGPRCRFCSQRRQSRRSGEGWISGQAARSRCPSASSAGRKSGLAIRRTAWRRRYWRRNGRCRAGWRSRRVR